MVMKKTLGVLAFIAVTALGHAQTGGPADSVAKRRVVQTARYEVSAEAGAEDSLASLARELELRFDVYNELFRFDPVALSAPLRVRVFQDPGSYDAYVSARLGVSRPGAVYLHYGNSERRELVVLRGSAGEAFALAHQAFIQFLRGFIPNPPTWVREGFAIYFNTLSYDPAGEALNYEENLAWLETIKGLGEKSLSLEDILLADTVKVTQASGVAASRFSRDFQISSWALVSFLLNSTRHFRTLTECFMTLSPPAGAEANSLAVMNRLALWNDLEALEAEYRAYLDSRKTFGELMEQGRLAYLEKDRINAEFAFLAALDQRPTHYGPYYYLGLLYYEEELYDMADENYRSSLEYGADEALVCYALGLNAISAGRVEDARTWLERAAAADPARYGAKAGDLLKGF